MMIPPLRKEGKMAEDRMEFRFIDLHEVVPLLQNVHLMFLLLKSGTDKNVPDSPRWGCASPGR